MPVPLQRGESPEDRGEGGHDPRSLAHLLQLSDVYAKFRPVRTDVLWMSLKHITDGEMTEWRRRGPGTEKKKKNQFGSRLHLAFSLANASRFSPRLSKPPGGPS